MCPMLDHDAQSGAAAGEATILVVDDTEANRYTISRYLRAAGYTVAEAATGGEGLRRAAELRPDLVILDVRLPDLSGFEVAQALRGDPTTADIPLLHISASFTDTGSHVHGLENGADGYLTHPVDPPLLNATVSALLRTRDAERRARQTARQWRATFDAIRDGVCLIDVHGRIVRCNRAFTGVMGMDYSELLGRDLGRIVLGTRTAAEPPFIFAADGAPLADTELSLGGRWVEVSAETVYDEQDTAVGGVCVLTDVTARRDAEDRVRHAQKMEAVGRLAGGVAHEINNMMTVILGFSDYALRDLDARDPRHSDLRQIHRAAERAAEVSQQLLAFSRRQILQPRLLEVNAVLGDMGKVLHQLMGADRDVQIQLTSEQTPVRVDRGQLEQVVINLALNARDATPAGGRFTIETELVTVDAAYLGRLPGVDLQPGRYVRIAASDTGHGMNRETAAHIFEPFFTTKPVGQGTGLGLATVYGIVRQSDGYIWASSEPERGTTFRIYLPLVDELPRSAPALPEPEQVAQGAGRTVLVVEDEEMVRSLAARILDAHGYTVLEAGNGREAIELLERYGPPVDLALVDVVMPGMNGRELGRWLGETRPTTPVLYMSGYTDDEIIRRGLLDPESSYLQKPFDADGLAERVRRLLEESPRR